MGQACDNCYNHILKRGLFPRWTCLELRDEQDNPLGKATEADFEANGKGCPAWHPAAKITRG